MARRLKAFPRQASSDKLSFEGTSYIRSQVMSDGSSMKVRQYKDGSLKVTRECPCTTSSAPSSGALVLADMTVCSQLWTDSGQVLMLQPGFDARPFAPKTERGCSGHLVACLSVAHQEGLLVLMNLTMMHLNLASMCFAIYSSRLSAMQAQLLQLQLLLYLLGRRLAACLYWLVWMHTAQCLLVHALPIYRSFANCSIESCRCR